MKKHLRKDDPCPLIDFSELSRIAAGHPTSIRRNRIPKKHRAKFSMLFLWVNSWANEHYPQKKQP